MPKVGRHCVTFDIHTEAQGLSFRIAYFALVNLAFTLDAALLLATFPVFEIMTVDLGL